MLHLAAAPLVQQMTGFVACENMLGTVYMCTLLDDANIGHHPPPQDPPQQTGPPGLIQLPWPAEACSSLQCDAWSAQPGVKRASQNIYPSTDCASICSITDMRE